MDKLDLNSATLEELSRLPGSTVEMARVIVDARKRGPFKSVYDLSRLFGFSLADVANLQQYVIVTEELDGKAGEQGLVGSAAEEQKPGRLNLDKATLEELMKVPGVGRAKAEAIINYRKEHGDFSSVLELANVPGISASSALELQEFFSIAGEEKEPEQPVQVSERGRAEEKGIGEAQPSAKSRSDPQEGLPHWVRIHPMEVHEYQTSVAFYGNQFAQVGHLHDMWADLIEGYGDKVEEFWVAFYARQQERGIKGLRVSWDNLQATGVGAPTRKMAFLKRSPVTITVFIAKQGADLYISWRAFVQAEISQVKLAIIGVVCLLFACPASIEQEITFAGTDTHFNFGNFLVAAIGVAIFAAIALSAWGFFYRQGDFLALAREPLNELQVDDVNSLAAAVHKSVIHSADDLGIDTAKLEVHEPSYKRRPPRL